MARKKSLSGSLARLDTALAAPTEPRRSSRHARPSIDTIDTSTTEHNVIKTPTKGAGVMPTANYLEHEDDSSSLSDVPRAEVEQAKDKARHGVNRAIKGLAKMEKHLMRETKRQKLQVQASKMVVETGAAAITMSNPNGKDAPKKGRKRKGVASLSDADSDYVQPEKTAQSDEEHAIEQGPNGDSSQAADRGSSRPSPVNSDYLPLPWKGRLGYACLNTYLRSSKPPVFSSRTCRMASIIDHRHPLTDPSQPEHPTKNRPDKTKDADPALGQKFVRDLGLANARDIIKMLRWNDKYGIKFMRLSSEMFPFASHHEHGYKLAGFAADVLAEAGRVAGELGHRLTTHPGQFTQLGSPRKEVVTAALRDLEYHDELLTLLKLPPQQDRDAVMILHMGGVFGDKAATLDRFRHVYRTQLTDSIKRRLVLENDDVSWSVHELLPVCEELNIPLVLDWHHHNIVFDSASGIREGTLDISDPAIQERIAYTWRRKGITQKMHYSEPCPGAVTPRDRRKHRPRVATLPPCAPDMDLMIEAKDKEQAVFELMKTFRLPGHELINDMIPHEREDECKAPVKKKIKVNKRKRKGQESDEIKTSDPEDSYEVLEPGRELAEEDVGMGGPDRRVYWHPGMEDWLRPKKKDSIITNGGAAHEEAEEAEE